MRRSAAALALRLGARALARAFAAGALALLYAAAGARALAPAPQAPDAGIEQHLAAPLPLALRFVDSRGAAVKLGDYFGDRPVLLVLGYYRCPQLCGLLMHGLLEALHDSQLARADYRIVRVSIDPADTPASATARRDVDLRYAAALESSGAAAQPAPLALELLTGTPAPIAELARSVGFRYSATGGGDVAPEAQREAGADGRAVRVDSTGSTDAAALARFAHGAAVVVAGPDGRISRYLMGVRFDPHELRLAVVDASAGRIGSWTDRIALLCAHVDPRLGRYSAVLLDGMRAFGIALVLLLGAVLWRLHRRTQRKAAP
jgi:protein SCO1/2